ncbi:hypothetical protein QYF61_009067 [Mycteria americana]|uniref:Uncharacterized protein n=1 Tax=Mycteria americana TaxID=33587 RepID=A0AAN7NNF0_MYCAM|nr:hypothetical protein QYF61_009067 [Mycteria americana]
MLGPKPEQYECRNLKHKYVFSLFQQNHKFQCASEGLPVSHTLMHWDNEMGYYWTASKQCHICEEEARAPQNDLTDSTQGQDNLGRPRGTGSYQTPVPIPTTSSSASSAVSNQMKVSSVLQPANEGMATVQFQTGSKMVLVHPPQPRKHTCGRDGRKGVYRDTSHCNMWGLAHAYQALLNTIQYAQGEEKVSGSDDKMTGTVATPVLATGTVATPTPATGTAAEPGNQPVLKKSWKRKSACLVRDDEKAGPSREEEEEQLINEMVTT